MRPLHRKGSNKRRAAKQFKRNIGRTKAFNIKTSPMRGGIRL